MQMLNPWCGGTRPNLPVKPAFATNSTIAKNSYPPISAYAYDLLLNLIFFIACFHLPTSYQLQLHLEFHCKEGSLVIGLLWRHRTTWLWLVQVGSRSPANESMAEFGTYR